MFERLQVLESRMEGHFKGTRDALAILSQDLQQHVRQQEVSWWDGGGGRESLERVRRQEAAGSESTRNSARTGSKGTKVP